MENHFFFLWEDLLQIWSFSIAMLNYQRVIQNEGYTLDISSLAVFPAFLEILENSSGHMPHPARNAFVLLGIQSSMQSWPSSTMAKHGPPPNDLIFRSEKETVSFFMHHVLSMDSNDQ